MEENALATSIRYNNGTCPLKLTHQKTCNRDIRHAEHGVQRKYLVLRGAHRASTHKSRNPIAQLPFYPLRRSPSRWILFKELLLAAASNFSLVALYVSLRSMESSL